MDFLTPHEARILAAARFILDAIPARTNEVLRTIDGSHPIAIARDGHNLGKVASRADVAAGAIFDVMNATSTYLEDPVAKRHLHETIDPSEFETPFGPPLTAAEVMANEG